MDPIHFRAICIGTLRLTFGVWLGSNRDALKSDCFVAMHVEAKWGLNKAARAVATRDPEQDQICEVVGPKEACLGLGFRVAPHAYLKS